MHVSSRGKWQAWHATATMATREISCLGSAGEVVDKSRDQGQGALHEQERDHRPDFR